jgi:hypothetical protein
MAYYDIDRRRDGVIGSAPSASGSFDPNAIPYQYTDAYDSEGRVQFPYESQWIQITALTSDAVKYSFKLRGTAGSNCGAVAGGSTSPILPIKASEIYVLNDAAITVGMSLIVSGTNTYDLDERY